MFVYLTCMNSNILNSGPDQNYCGYIYSAMNIFNYSLVLSVFFTWIRKRTLCSSSNLVVF